MPQIFQVLRCYKCLIFQVHQTKKANKWQCKLCAEKQSIKRHYGIGTGKECRLHVQKLNGIQGKIDEENNSVISDEDYDNIDQQPKYNSDSNNSTKESKWLSYLDQTNPDNIESMDDDNSFIGDAQIVLEIPNKHRKTLSKNRSKRNIPKSMQSRNVFSKNKYEESDNIQPVDNNSFMKSVQPIKNINSKWTQYDNKLKNNGDNINIFKSMKDTCGDEVADEINSFNTVKNTEQNKIFNTHKLYVSSQVKEYKKKIHEDYIETSNKVVGNDLSRKNALVCTPETITLKRMTAKISKWDKFTEKSEDSYDNNCESPTLTENSFLKNTSQDSRVTKTVALCNDRYECLLVEKNNLKSVGNENIFDTDDTNISNFTSLFDNNDFDALDI